MDPSTPPARKRHASNVLVYLVLLVAFGIFLPWQKGIDFFDPVLISAYACIGLVFAGPAAAQAFESRPPSMAQALRRILNAVVFGESVAIAMLACGFLTVRLTHRRLLFGPDLVSLGYALILGMAACMAVAALAGWVTVQFSAGAARLVMRLVFLALLAAFFLKSHWLPSVALPGALIAAAAGTVFLLLLWTSLKRA
jgi:hypothetical protein